MIRYLYRNLLNDGQRKALKARYYRWNKALTDRFFSYDQDQLKNALGRLGIREGDTLLVHSSFKYFSGFRGTPQDVIRCFCELVGTEGNLLMVSMPYTCASSEYLNKNPVFDVRRTVSKMGIVSEVFRRRKDVRRSLHATHPVLAWGKDAAWIIQGHETCLYPCGKDTPFDKFRSLQGKILFFNVPFRAFTFLHYLEDLIRDRLPFPLYAKSPITVKMRDYEGNGVEMKTHVFGDTTVRTRNPDILEARLLKERLLKKGRVGRTRLMLVSAEDAVSCTERMLSQNLYFYNPEARVD